MNNTLRQALRRTRELRNQVENLLLGDDGDMYESELKKWVARRPCWMPKTTKAVNPTFELYLFGKQKTGGYETGHAVEAHLKETGLINRCLSKDDEVVNGWLANPETYPEEFKEKAVFLWKSTVDRHGSRNVAYLFWDGGHVLVAWLWLGAGWGGINPALLASLND